MRQLNEHRMKVQPRTEVSNYTFAVPDFRIVFAAHSSTSGPSLTSGPYLHEVGLTAILPRPDARALSWDCLGISSCCSPRCWGWPRSSAPLQIPYRPYSCKPPTADGPSVPGTSAKQKSTTNTTDSEPSSRDTICFCHYLFDSKLIGTKSQEWDNACVWERTQRDRKVLTEGPTLCACAVLSCW